MDQVQIPESKLQQFCEAFEKFDKDNDGLISLRELTQVIKFLNLNNDYNQEHLSSMMEKLSNSNTGKINVDEFLRIITAKYKETDAVDEVIAAFRTFDKDGNGTIPANELKHIMITLGERLTDEEVDEMIKEADFNGDGFIKYEEFVKSMLSK